MRILVLALLPIGDTLFATPAIHALRVRYPQARITAVVYPTNAAVLRNSPDIDRILLWPIRQNWPGVNGVLGLFHELRGERFDLSVEFSNYSWWISRVSGARKRIEMNMPRLWWVRPGAGKEWRKRHAVEHYCDVVKRISIEVTDLRLRFPISDEERTRAEAWLKDHSVMPGEVLVGVHPGGEGLWGRKRWDVRGFARVVDGLHREVGACTVLMGGPDDAPLAAQIEAMTRGRVINATAQTTLGETAALASMCDLFIGNDSSPLHIAAAAGTKVVGIYGLTDPRSYRPWVPGGREGLDYAMVRSPLPCACCFPLAGGITFPAWGRCLLCPALKAVTPRQVLDSAMGILAAGRAH